MSSPAISIVIPMYNVEKFIDTCIDSILKQTFQNFELILIDDHSTDRTFEIAFQKYSTDPRIKILQNSRRLHCDITRSIGLARACGEYIYFMDADDAILPNVLETFYQAIKNSDAEVVLMNTCFTTENQKFKLPMKIECAQRIFNDPTPRFFDQDITQRFNHELFERGCNWEPWTRIQRRDFLINNGITFPDTLRTGDLLFHLAELCFAKKIQVINAFGYIWRQHPNQTIKLPAEELLKLGIQSFPAGLKYIREIFESDNLLSTLSAEKKYYLELQSMIFYLTKSINLKGIETLQMRSIVQEMVLKSDVCAPEFVMSLFNIFLTQTILINEQNKKLKTLSAEVESKSKTES